MQRFVKKVWGLMPLFVRVWLIRLVQPTFTASAVAVVRNPAGEVLLLKHLLRTRSGWGLPGGFLKRGEQPDSAIVREIMEETGLRIDHVRQIGTRTLNWRHLEIMFEAKAAADPEVKSIEILEAGWFAQNGLPAGIPRDQVLLIARILSREV